ncbi:hypothetical protein NL676_012737 [Syzygium grande]|nr:hypothetical protein NL676_012737 [Syzygium grande]
MSPSSDKEMSKNCHAWAARDDSGLLFPYEFERRAAGSDDVSVKITHCGICYADVVYTRNKIKNSVYPLVPGHEIVGIVEEVGGNVGKFKIGDHVGVGTYLDSCKACENCEDAQEIYCLRGVTMTINGTYEDGSITQGGYSSFIVVHEKALSKTLDFIVDTASGDHPFDLYLPLLKTGGVLALVGYPGEEIKVSPLSLLMGMRTVSGSSVGGTKRTQQMLEFCSQHEIYPDVEVIPIQYANEALERLQKGNVKYRFVIDIENSLE